MNDAAKGFYRTLRRARALLRAIFWVVLRVPLFSSAIPVENDVNCPDRCGLVRRIFKENAEDKHVTRL